MKALEILKSINRISITDRAAGLLDLAIAELEALDNRSCENCKYDYIDIDDNCERCNRYYEDKFEIKASK